jgi:hypothetical protein
VLESNKFNRKAIFDIAGHSGSRLPDGNGGTDPGPLVTRNARARQRDVDDAALYVHAIRQDELGRRVVRGGARMTTLFR